VRDDLSGRPGPGLLALARRPAEERSEALAWLSNAAGNRMVAALLQRDGPTQQGGSTAVASKPAASMSEYVALVRALEDAHPGLSPRELLTLLRTVYYGKPWSIDKTAEWKDVLPSAPAVDDPRKRAGSGPGSLYEALRQSRDIGGMEIGHVLTGLEAMIDPRPSVVLEGPAGLPIGVAMSNVEFATWGGDVGSVAAMRMADRMTDVDQRSPIEYFRQYASSSDLEGDIDAFAIQSQVKDVRKALPASLGNPFLPRDDRVSDLLARFFLVQGPDALPERSRKYSSFIGQLGGTMRGGKITNRMKILERLAPRVQSFAQVFMLNEIRKRKGAVEVGVDVVLTMTGDDEWVDVLEEYTWDAIDQFLDWLEERAAKE
jgi:hypothetical protein